MPKMKQIPPTFFNKAIKRLKKVFCFIFHTSAIWPVFSMWMTVSPLSSSTPPLSLKPQHPAEGTKQVFLEILPPGNESQLIAEDFLKWASSLRCAQCPTFGNCEPIAKIDLRKRLFGIAGLSGKTPHNLSNPPPFITEVILFTSSAPKPETNLTFAPKNTDSALMHEISTFFALDNTAQQHLPRILGYCMLTRSREATENIVLFCFYMHPSVRRLGLGHLALGAIKNHCKRKGYKKLSLEVYEHNQFVKKMYINHNFRVIHTEVSKTPPFTAHRMECRL